MVPAALHLQCCALHTTGSVVPAALHLQCCALHTTGSGSGKAAAHGACRDFMAAGGVMLGPPQPYPSDPVEEYRSAFGRRIAGAFLLPHSPWPHGAHLSLSIGPGVHLSFVCIALLSLHQLKEARLCVT